MGKLQSAFRCGCFPNERKLRPCYTSHFLTVPFASLLFPIALTAFLRAITFAAENSKT